MLVFFNVPPLVLHFFLNDLPDDDVIWNIFIYADDTILSVKCNQASDLWQQLDMAAEQESDQRDTVDWNRKQHNDFKAGITQIVSFDQSNKHGAVDVKMNEPVLKEKLSFKMLRLSFSSKITSKKLVP